MGFDENVEMIRLAFYQVLISSGPFLGAALAIGLIIGIIQAATSIQEMTLSFVPKIVLVIFVFKSHLFVDNISPTTVPISIPFVETCWIEILLVSSSVRMEYHSNVFTSADFLCRPWPT